MPIVLSDLSAKQIENARTIYDTAIPFGVDAAKAALMTACAESSFLVYANNGNTTRDDVPQKWRDLAALSMGFPHDAVAGEAWTTADSCGWFQQRAMYGYCTPDRAGIGDLMSPESVRIFIRGSRGGSGTTRFFLQSPGTLTLAQRCQWTQGSEYPTGENYAPMEPVADQLIARFAPPTEQDWTDMATAAEVKTAFGDALDSRDVAKGAAIAALSKKLDALAAALAVEDRETDATDAFLRDKMTVRSLVTKQNYNLDDFVAFIDANLNSNTKAQAAQAADLKALLADLKAIVATPAPAPAPEVPATPAA